MTGTCLASAELATRLRSLDAIVARLERQVALLTEVFSVEPYSVLESAEEDEEEAGDEPPPVRRARRAGAL
jgi:hypothetical protein